MKQKNYLNFGDFIVQKHEEKLAHAGHPVLRWMMDNIYIKTDSAENIKLYKAKSTECIDRAVAAIMVPDRVIVAVEILTAVFMM